MTIIAIAYFSKSGLTSETARHIAKGISSVQNCMVELVNVEDMTQQSWETLDAAEAMIFGTPTYMGSVAGPFKIFMDQSGSPAWINQKWKDKLAAGFTVATHSSGDKLNTLIQMSIFAAQHGMIWVGQNQIGSKITKDGKGINEYGSWLGLSITVPDSKDIPIRPNDAETARLFGIRVAEAAVKWSKPA